MKETIIKINKTKSWFFEKIKKFLETNDKENMTTQSLWDAVKVF